MTMPLSQNSLTMADNGPELFDYDQLLQGTATELRQHAEAIKFRIARATTDILETGRDLLNAKSHLGHGMFLKWLELELGMAARTAQQYMAAAKFALADGKYATVALLPPTTIHRLASKSTPQDIASQVVKRAEEGEVLTDNVVSHMIREAQFRSNEAERFSKESKRRKESARQREERQKIEQRRQEILQKSEDEAKSIAIAIADQIGPDAVQFLLERVSSQNCIVVMKHLRDCTETHPHQREV